MRSELFGLMLCCGAPRNAALLDAYIGESVPARPTLKSRHLRDELSIHASFKMVDTCAAEFDAATPYYYSTYDDENEAKGTGPVPRRCWCCGSGPIRIGQGIEFDYCSVHSRLEP